MTRRQERESRSIDNPQSTNANDLRIRIHDRIRITLLPHRARTRRMKHSVETLPDEIQNLLVGMHIPRCSREILVADKNRFHGFRLVELARALVAGDHDGLVGGVGEPVGVDQRRVGHVGGGDVDCAARERGDEGDGHGAVLVAVGRRVADEVLLEAEEGGGYQVFDFGPVGGEFG